MTDPPLHRMNPQSRFSDRAADYAKYRPPYPASAIDCILAGLEPLNSLVVVDIGAGTGIASRLLAERGIQVIAIEPNLAMQQAAEPHDRVTFQTGSAESTGLLARSVDLITCFQAFHWFDPQPSLAEFQRILKPSGRLAVVWNDRDPQDRVAQAYTHLLQVASNYHPAESRLKAIEPLFNSSLFTQVRQHAFPYLQSLDEDSLIGRTMSVSYIPREGALQQQLVRNLKALHQRFQDATGHIALGYTTYVYLAKVA